MGRKKNQAVTRTEGNQSRLATPDARANLPYLEKPLWYRFAKGQFLGYGSNRRLPGTWFARVILKMPDGKEFREQEAIGLADDKAVGTPQEPEILSYEAALQKAIAWCEKARKPESSTLKTDAATRRDKGPEYSTMAECLDAYGKSLNITSKRSRRTAETRREQMKEEIGHWEPATLTRESIDLWKEEFIRTPPMVRRKKGGEPVYKKGWDPEDEDNQRARKNTCNRWLGDLKAALNYTRGKNGAVSSFEWDSVKSYAKVTKSRGDAMSKDEERRFLNQCWPEFRPLAFGALSTAARYSELRTMKVKDFSKRTLCVTVEAMYAKNGKLRHIPLTDEGVTFFLAITKGRSPHEPMFVRANGQIWEPSEQHRPMKGITHDVNIDVCFHGLRHTRITQLIEDGMEYAEVCEIAGASESIIRLHYKHVKPDALRKKLNARVRNLGIPEEVIQKAMAKLNEESRMEEEALPPFEFDLNDLHPSAYAGKVNGGREEAPPPRNKPSVEALEALLLEDISAEKIGKMFDVSGTTVRKWCRAYGIQPPGLGYHAKQRALRAAIEKANANVSSK
jgi:integrase